MRQYSVWTAAAGLLLFLSFQTMGWAQDGDISRYVDVSKLVEVNAGNKSRCVNYFLYKNKNYCSFIPLVPKNIAASGATEHLNIKFDNRNWIVGDRVYNPMAVTNEYIPAGETIDHWNELITSQLLIGLKGVPINSYLSIFKNDLLKQGYRPTFTLHEQNPNEAVFEFKLSEPKAEAQDEIQRILSTPQGYYILHYAIRQPDMLPANRQKWIGLLKQATIKP